MSALITFLFALEIYAVQYVLPPVVIYLFWLIKRYGKSLRRLAKPLFWVQLIIILALAVLLWQNRTEGLIVGIKMIVRAVLVVTIFTAISVELKNPLVKALLYKRGYSQLYATLGLATSAVPFILKNLAVSKKDFFNPFKILRKSVGLSDILFSEFKEHLNSKNTIYIISGETRSGKTTFLKQIISELKQAKNYKINGIIAHGIDRNNERFGFEIENIATEQKQILCTQEPVENAKKIGRFYFNNEGLSFGKKALLDNIDTADLLVIDEIGYMELKGKGWFSVIEQAMDYPDLDMIWVVRKRILEEVLQLWQHSNIKVIDINIHKSAAISKQLLKNNKYDNR
jgi:nucleoside-triphosphatase THEP1